MLKRVLLSMLLAVSAGAGSIAFAGDDDSISDSVVNIWNKVSDAASKGGRIVKDKSVEVGHDVSDKAVEAWEWANDDDTTEPELEDRAFGDESIGVDSLQDQHDADEVEKSKSFTGKVSSSAAELWGRVAEAFSSDDSAVDSGYPSRAGLWEEVNVDLSEIAEKLQKQDSLPDDSLFGEDQESNRKKIDKMLTEVLDILEVTDVSKRKQEYANLEADILEKNTEIITYKEKMILAPQKVEGVDKVWKNSVEDYKKKIRVAQDEIKELKAAQKQLLTVIQEELLARSGIKLSDDQVYSLVVMVSGDSFITLNSIFYNIKQLVSILEELTEENKDYINTIKKYYGMYAVLIEALDLSHEIEIRKIKDGYLPKLKEYRVRAQIASSDTKALMRKNKGNAQNLAMLKNNLRAQAEIYTAAGAYHSYLTDYLERIEISKKVIESQLAVVTDTWKTTQLASGLLSVMESSSAGLQDLISMELPSIKPLNVGKLKDQLSMISMEIRE